MDVADYDQMIHVPVQVPTLVDLAVRHALARRTVSHLTIPTDMQIADADANPYSAPAPAAIQPTAAVYCARPAFPDPPICGGGRRPQRRQQGGHAGRRRSAGRPRRGAGRGRAPGSPIVKTLPGKAVVHDDHPLTTGGIGLLGTAPSEEAMESCDTLLMVGTNFPYTKHLPEPGQLQGGPDRGRPHPGRQPVPTDVPLIGDAKETLRALLPPRPQTRPGLPRAGPEGHGAVA